MTNKFAAEVDEMIKENVALLRAVGQVAIQSLVHQITLPVREGGDMPIDTGFLWNSDAASLTGMPSGEGNKQPNVKYVRDGAPVQAVINQMKVGENFYYGWTAEYAVKLNDKYGFLDKGLQNWQDHVDRAVAEAKRRVKR